MPNILRPAAIALVALGAAAPLRAQEQLVTATLTYAAPATGQPAPNFSPKGTQVVLTEAPASLRLPAGAVRPARVGVIEVGPDKASWVPVLVTASKEFPADLHQLWLDRNRNGVYTDEGQGMTAKPTQNEKTRAWWSSLSATELTLPYSTTGATEPYLINFWLVRDDSLPPPDVLRYSVRSWRSGKVTVAGVEAVVAAMDSDNNALFDKEDTWSVLGASEKDAPKAVLSITEAKPTSRFMFVPKDGREIVLEFRSFSPDGRSITFAVTDKMMTKAADRAPDDMLRDERPRPRATVPFVWAHGAAEFDAVLARAKAEGKKVMIDFETTWCGPCKSMDQWIWTDKEVAEKLSAGYVGIKFDGDLEKAHVKTYGVAGYPTMVILDPTGKVLHKVTDYLGSKQMLELLGKLQ